LCVPMVSMSRHVNMVAVNLVHLLQVWRFKGLLNPLKVQCNMI